MSSRARRLEGGTIMNVQLALRRAACVTVPLLAGLLSCGLVRGQEPAEKPELFLQTGHSEGVSSIAFSPDGSLLASGGGSAVKIWDARTRCLLRTLPVAGLALSVAFGPDG